jgi:hypothetical protein
MATTVQYLQTQQVAISFITGSGRLDTVVLFASNLFSLLMKLEFVCLKNSQNNLCLSVRFLV